MNTTHLIGSEQVERAGHNIAAAGTEISRAASTIEQAAAQLKGALDTHGYMLSALMERMDTKGPRAVTLYQRLHTHGQPVEIKEIGKGLFLQWGDEFEEFENGPGNCTVAIVEMPGGTVQTFMPNCIKFEVPS